MFFPYIQFPQFRAAYFPHDFAIAIAIATATTTVIIIVIINDSFRTW